MFNFKRLLRKIIGKEVVTSTVKQQWVAALRSGDYKKGIGRLKKIDSENEVCYCSLGVLADIINPDGWTFDSSTDNFAFEKTSYIKIDSNILDFDYQATLM